jgi:ribosomal protein S12 methylthiotransferase
MKKIGFVSLGCPKNLVDSEVMMGLVERQGLTLTPNEADADIIVVNTCAFIDPAKEESVDTILEMAELKKTGRCQKLIVAGCLVERYRDQLLQEMPEIDAIIGTNEIERIVEACNGSGLVQLRKMQPDDHGLNGSGRAMEYLYDHTRPRVLSTPRYSAYIKIAEGCDHTCSFCIIPKLRGQFRSRTIESVVQEAEWLADQGVKEVVLVSQDTTHYGEDLGLKEGLPLLLKKLARVAGLDWVRFLYCYPNHVSDMLINTVADEATLCKYFDIPLQHASARTLKAMLRGGTRASLERMVEKIRRRIPDAALRTTFIVGFPGETDEDFQELVSFCRAVEFDHVGVFTYSDEDGTTAFDYGDKVPRKVAAARQRRLMKDQAKISRRKNRGLVGKDVEVLLEGYSKESELLLQGRMESQAPEIDGCVLINEIPESAQFQAGDFVPVRITQALDHDLVGRVTDCRSRTVLVR